MPPFRRMLVALAATPADDHLVSYAAMLARILPGIAISYVHVREPGSAAVPAVPCQIVEGDVLDALLECAGASGADLLLLGHSGRGRRSLARRLAMKAPCSVWMAPDGSPVTLDRILVPVDLSRSSADTLSVAAALTALAGQDECCALHVYFNDAPVTFDEFEEVIADDHDQAFALFIAPVDLHGVFTKPLFVESAHVGRTILNVAAQRGCDLIVMGTRGRSRSAAVLLGSETEQIMMDTSVPVLAVKHRGAQLRLRQALADQRLQHGRDPRYS